LIFATGFAAVRSPIIPRQRNGSNQLTQDVFSLPVYGRSKSIQQYFDEEKGPQAYLGTVIPGFPNFFTILGESNLRREEYFSLYHA